MEENKEKIVIATLLIIIILLWILLQILTNQLYTSSIDLNNSQNEANQLQIVNNKLKSEDLQGRSYTKLEQEAKATGFIPAPFLTP